MKDDYPEHTRRLGKFTISWDLIEDNPEIVRELLSKMIVIRAETMYHYRHIEYVALCEDFEVLSEGCRIPDYDIQIDSKATNITKLKNAGTRKLILVPSEEIT